MKKIALSALAALTLESVTVNAGVTKLYQDVNGQVFTKPAEGRTLINNKVTSVFSHSKKLQFSGLAYLGYTYNNYKSDSTTVNYNKDTSDFEVRRAYFQLKAYLLDDQKSYYRITFDVSKDATGDEKFRAKYAYLFLNNIFVNTGVEIGLIHRPWHDYEEHNGWLYRNISKILIEDGTHGPNLSNSADFGVMFKTRTQYFDADYGIFNGEGYHATNNGTGMSFEWRTTAHILGMSSHHHPEKNTYWDASFFGQYNKEHKTVTVGAIDETQDLIFGGLHTVYNQPSFLFATQYVYSENTSDIANNISVQAGDGYSFNVEYRLGEDKEYRVFGRYDSWTPKNIPVGQTSKKDNRGYILGTAWEMNPNIQWVANVIITDNETGSLKERNNGVAYMLTAEVRF